MAAEPARTVETAAAVIAALALSPHPKGGFYRETFRDDQCDAHGRAASTAIYFLLPAGVVSRWHRVVLETRLRHDPAEVWHWHAGAALALSIADASGARTSITLGTDFANGQQPQGVVPAHHRQQAESLGAWTLEGARWRRASNSRASIWRHPARVRAPSDSQFAASCFWPSQPIFHRNATGGLWIGHR